MRVALLLLAGFSLSAPGGWAQEEPSQDVPDDQVTALVRAALAAPNAPESWAGLAEGLAGLKAGMPLDATGLEAAIRIADSLAFSPGLTVMSTQASEETPSGSLTLPPVPESIEGLIGDSFGDPVGLISLFGLLMGSWLILGKLWELLGLGRRARAFALLVRGVSRVATGSRSVPVGAGSAPQDPRALALALSQHGLPANEVARQTGLAQDEVAVVLALRGGSDAFGTGSFSPRRRSA